MDTIAYKNALFIMLVHQEFITPSGDGKWKFVSSRTNALKGSHGFDGALALSREDIVDTFARGVQNVDITQLRAVA